MKRDFVHFLMPFFSHTRKIILDKITDHIIVIVNSKVHRTFKSTMLFICFVQTLFLRIFLEMILRNFLILLYLDKHKWEIIMDLYYFLPFCIQRYFNLQVMI